MKKLLSICGIVTISLVLLTGCQHQTLEPVENEQTLGEIASIKADALENFTAVTKRSLEELLNAQGTTIIPPPANLPDGLWYYPYPNTLGWTG